MRRTLLIPTLAGSGAIGAGVLGFLLIRRWRRLRAAMAPEVAEAADIVEEGSMESFPASDPPSTMSPTTSL